MYINKTFAFFSLKHYKMHAKNISLSLINTTNSKLNITKYN